MLFYHIFYVFSIFLMKYFKNYAKLYRIFHIYKKIKQNKKRIRRMKNDIAVFYQEWIKLKDLLRSGWVQTEVPLARTESVADHVFSCAMLAWAIIEEEHLNLDKSKVLQILLLHEVGEIYIGDITPKDGMSREEKYQKEYMAVKSLSEKVHIPAILTLWLEFENMETNEAKFCKMIDRLECVMQAKSYAERTNTPSLFEEFYTHAEREIQEGKKYLL